MFKRRVLSEEDELAGAVRMAASRVGSTVTSYDGETVSLHGRLSGTVALSDLRAACRLEPRANWNRVVQVALHGLALSQEDKVDLRDFTAARPRLRSRVYTEGALLVEDVVSEPLASGLVEVLVADVSGAVTTIPSAVAHGWGVDLAGVFDCARQQTLDAGLPIRSELDLDGVVLTALELPTPFAATHVHWLPSYLDVPPSGALVVMPTRHLLLVATLQNRQQTLDAAQAMLVNADRLESEGPGGLSPDLYWWHPPDLVLLPGSPTSLSPPAEFIEVLDTLPAT